MVAMKTFEFELVFRLGNDEHGEIWLDSLHEHGCDDATVATGRVGVLVLQFVRSARSAGHAVESGICNTIKAIPHARFERAGPDLLNLTELADLFGCTKQNLSKYAARDSMRGRQPFPIPVVNGKSTYWHGAEVAAWLQRNASLAIDEALSELLGATRSLNQAREQIAQRDSAMGRRFIKLLSRVA